MSRKTVSLLGALALGASLMAAPTLAGAQPAEPGPSNGPPSGTPGDPADVPVSETGSYVVVMEGEPLVVTEGREGVDSSRGRARAAEMRAKHDEAASSVGAEPINEYTVALNGFSAVLDHADAERLAGRKDVRMVLPDVLRQPTTDASGDFLGLTGPGGAYASGFDGEGVVVGVIDTGIWPEHPSFADDGSYPEPPITLSDERPTCEFGNTAHNPADADFTCNNKLVGARQMLDTYRELTGAEPSEFDSARDDDGHGTHTASTAAGNADVAAEVNGHDLGTVTGIAPRAHIVAYKGLGALGGYSSDLAAAIDQAVADGVDVINYSIGGGPSLVGADDIAFLYAADAGVHVATSAGNDGPGAGTIGGPASVPWVTTVGASTQTRFFQGTVRLGNGAEYVGASLTGSVDEQTRLVDAEDATADGDDLCVPGTLDERLVRDAIVLCRRGAIARVDKSLAVAQAGGVGMIMYENDDSGDRFTDNHYVPSVHVDNTEGLAIKAYIDTGRGRGAQAATAALVDTGTKGTFEPAPSMTSFSSRGPDTVAPDLIKPDVTAPGMQILAGASPYADPNGNDFQSIAGTSMSSPHVAGLMALLDQARPDWTPAMVKSALMTSARQDVVDNDRVSPADPFDMGAGHVDPGTPGALGSAFDPGIVYDAGFNEYLGFLCEAAPEALGSGTCQALADQGVPTTATDLNVPSIGASAVPGQLTVTRTVTGTSRGRPQTWTAEVDAPEGFDVSVSPSQFTVREGETVDYTVTITSTGAPVGEWRYGSLTWVNGAARAYSPIAVQGAAFDAPTDLTATGESGTASMDVSFGYTGTYEAAGHGLVAATETADTVVQDPDQTFDPADGNSNAHAIEVSDAAHLRVAIPPEATEADADLDLFLADPTGAIVATSTNGATDEQIDVADPADGTWTLYVHGWAAPGDDSPYTLYDWVVPNATDGSLTVTSAPSSAVQGQTGTIEVAWSGATAGRWHLGAVSHNRGDEVLGLTMVEVDNRQG